VRRRAFTLIELLVVIGIIAMLIAILLPTLARARAQSQSVQCLSNLHELSLAAEQYCVASGGYYPIANLGTFRTPWSYSYEWDFTTATNVVTGQIVVTPGLLWPGVAAAPVQQCPSFDGSANAPGNPFAGYNYNTSYLGSGVAPALCAKAAGVHHPAQCALFGDGQYYNGGDKFMRSPQPSPADLAIAFKYAASGTQGFRHRGGTNVVFCDGHGETLFTCYTKSSDTHAVGAGTGFLSADNSFYNGQ